MKVAVITGASTGIGAAVARVAASKGHSLVLVARRRDKLEAVAEECRSLGAESLAVVGDLQDRETLPRIIEETIGRFSRIDVLLNNAGFGLPTLYADSDPEDIRSQIEVNFTVPLILTRLALPHLMKTKGVVINVGSAITAVPNPALGAYGATKAALAYWSSALRREIAHLDVSVCLVEPGPIKTDFFESLSKRNKIGQSHHPMLDAPSDWMSVGVEVAAKRIVRLMEKPKGRLSVPKRFVWPWRLIGAFYQIFPRIGDASVSSIVRHYDGQIDRSTRHEAHVGRPSGDD